VVVASAFVVLLVSVVALGTGSLLVARERDRAVKQRQRADRRLDQARRVVDRLYTQVVRNRLENQPKMQGLQHELLQEALGFYRELIEDEGADPAVRRETAAAYFRVGEVAELLDRNAEAEDAYRRCLALREALASQSPNTGDLAHELAAVLVRLGRRMRLRGRADEFQALTRRGVELRFDLAARNPGNVTYRDALTLDVARYGGFLEGDNLERYEHLLRRAFGPNLELPPGAPSTPGFRRALARAHINLGGLLYLAGRFVDAEAHVRPSLALHSGLVEAGAGTLDDRSMVANCLNKLGAICMLTGRQAESREAFSRSLAVWDELVVGFPDVPGLVKGRAWNDAEFARALSVFPAPGDEPGRAVALARRALQSNPDDFGYRQALGAALYRAGDYRGAAAELAESERLRRGGGDPQIRFPLAMALARLGDTTRARTWFDRAKAQMGRDPLSVLEERALHDEAAGLLVLPDRPRVGRGGVPNLKE
jgi:tetratricopeptide (TPR) repeat protein